MEETVRTICSALSSMDIEKALSFFTVDAELTWGPYRFKGCGEIRKWMNELLHFFGKLSFTTHRLTIEGKRAIHEFILENNLQGFRGVLPAKATYIFKDGKIRSGKIDLSYGVIIFKRRNLNLHFTKFHLASKGLKRDVSG